MRAYAAVMNLLGGMIIASKTRVAALITQTVHRLELLSALLLARLFQMLEIICTILLEICTVLLIVLHWIIGIDKLWKPK
jgi:hypothetical protein